MIRMNNKERFGIYVADLSYSELKILKEIVDNEFRLCQIAIAEGLLKNMRRKKKMQKKEHKLTFTNPFTKK